MYGDIVTDLSERLKIRFSYDIGLKNILFCKESQTCYHQILLQIRRRVEDCYLIQGYTCDLNCEFT